MSNKSRRTRARFAPTPSFNPSPGGMPPGGAGHRQARLEHLVYFELQSLLTDEANDPALAVVRLVSVHLSIDGGHARVVYAVVQEPGVQQEQGVAVRTKTALVRATGFLRARLAHQLNLRRVPRLTFTFLGMTDVAPNQGPGGRP